jgi:peptidoglycan/xylan/chitin deacetylase (PgdA/CDA1 family)
MALRPVSVVRQAARRGLASVLPRRLYLTHGPQWSGTACLTFDDGPHPELTPRLLDLLAESGVSATFFLIGGEAEKYPAVVRRMKADGHAVGNHSYSHPVRETLSARQAAADVARGSAVLADILGQAPTLYRPPRGKVTAGDLWRLWRAGLTTVLWNVDPKDYNKPRADPVRDWFRARAITSGDLVLMHDTHPHALAVLPELIESARARGLSFTTVSEWAV